MLLALLVFACTGSAPEAPPDPAPPAPEEAREEAPAPAVAPAFDGTVAPSEGAGTIERPATLGSVRTGTHEGYDRAVFELREGLPGWHVSYVDRPVRRCGSGEAVELPGDGWLEIRLRPAQAHDEAGAQTVTSTSRKPGLPVLKQLVQTCDFEGTVTWVAAVSSPNPYRVLELSDPPRLVLDVAHDGALAGQPPQQ